MVAKAGKGSRNAMEESESESESAGYWLNIVGLV